MAIACVKSQALTPLHSPVLSSWQAGSAVFVVRSHVEGNVAGDGGGALSVVDSDLYVSRSDLVHNRAGLAGGGATRLEASAPVYITHSATLISLAHSLADATLVALVGLVSIHQV
jgi:hypothetical protein